MFDAKFDLAFSDLKFGKHVFYYQVKDEFFKDMPFSLIEKAELNLRLELEKNNDNHAIGLLFLEGIVILPCDYCAEDLSLNIHIEDTLLWTFMEHLTEPQSPVDNWLLPKQHKIVNIGQWIYDVITSNIPLKRSHEPNCRNNFTDFSEK